MKAPLASGESPKVWTVPTNNVPLMFGPNITGTFNGQQNSKGGSDGFKTHVSGAFLDSNPFPGAINQGVMNLGGGFGFEASKSNATYSKSSTVQPASLRLLPCIKI